MGRGEKETVSAEAYGLTMETKAPGGAGGKGAECCANDGLYIYIVSLISPRTFCTTMRLSGSLMRCASTSAQSWS